MNDTYSSSTIDQISESSNLRVKGMASIGIQISGTFVGTLVFEGTIDNITWVSVPLVVPDTKSEVTSTTSTGLWAGSVGGFFAIRVRSTAWTSGSARINLRASISGGGGGSGGTESLKYNATPPTLADGETGGAQADINGNLKTTDASGYNSTSDSIAAKLATDSIMNGNNELTPKFAVINHASSGDNTLVAAVTGKKIRVLALYFRNAGAVDVRFESGAGGTALSGVIETEAADPPFVLPFNPVGWFETAISTLLNLELGGAVSVDGGLVYVEI